MTEKITLEKPANGKKFEIIVKEYKIGFTVPQTSFTIYASESATVQTIAEGIKQAIAK